MIRRSQRWSARGWGLLVLLVSHAGSLGWGAGPDTVDLLTQPKSRWVSVSDMQITPAGLKDMTDGQWQTDYRVPSGKGAAWECICDLQGRAYTPEKLEIQLNVPSTGNGEGERLGTVEVWVSDLTDRIGFQSVWSMALVATSKPQSVELPRYAARWVMLRVVPASDTAVIRLAEVNLWGVPGRPKSHYAFKQSPAQALAFLDSLKSTTGDFSLSPEERSLFVDAQDGRLDAFSLAEAALLASGVADARLRSAYLQKLQLLKDLAPQMVAGQRALRARAEALLYGLHTRILTGGYRAPQSLLSELLDRRTFNCVSATVLFTLLARELQMDVHAVEVPDHVFAQVQADRETSLDVETTTAYGVDPFANPIVARKLQDERKLIYISPKYPELRRTVSDVGLVALVYYNRGVEYAGAKHYRQALIAFFCALSLDPELSLAVHNAMAVMTNWALALVEQKQYAEALRVVNTGLALVPQDLGFRDARQVIFTQWANAEIAQGHTDQALEVLQQARRLEPGETYERMQALVFLTPASEALRKREWLRALALAKQGRERVSPLAQRELDAWRQGVYVEWARAGLQQKNYASAVQALEGARSEAPDNADIQQNLMYALQEWAVALWKRQGRTAAEALLQQYEKKYPHSEIVARAAAGYVSQVLSALKGTPNYEPEALALVGACESWLASDPDAVAYLRGLFEQVIQGYLRVHDFSGALATAQRAQARFVGDEHWLKSEDLVRDEWIRDHQEKHRWLDALALAEQSLSRTTDKPFFEQKIAYLVQEYAEETARVKGLPQGRSVAEACGKRFAGNTYVATVVAAFQTRHAQSAPGKGQADFQMVTPNAGPTEGTPEYYDALADVSLQNQDWTEATRVYDEAVRRFPKHPRLRNNAAAVWDQWAQDNIKQKQWGNALDACTQALARGLMPDHFRKKIVYIVQEGGKAYAQAEDDGALERWLSAARKRFPDLASLNTVVISLYAQTLADLSLVDTRRYLQRGKSLLQGVQSVLGGNVPDATLVRNWCDRLAQERVERREWEDAVMILNAAREFLPNDKVMRGNEIASWNAWAQEYVKQRHWDVAIGIYEQALQRFPDETLFKNNLKYCQQKSSNTQN